MWPPKYVKLVGIELEGGWDEPPGQGMHTDVSVQVYAPYVGEVSSGALKPEEAIDWMLRDDIYPDYGNSSCGIHVHVSTTDNHAYSLLTDRAYEKAFLVGMRLWGLTKKLDSGHEFWKRLAGQNRYCTKSFIPECQMGRGKALSRDARRTQLNFTAFKKYGTLECRMLPYFQEPDIAADGVQKFITLTDDFINLNYEKELAAFVLKPPTPDAAAYNITRSVRIKCA